MGHTVKYAYESKSLASVTQPGESGLRWQFKYNTEHEMTSETDGRSHAIITEYDASHRVISQTDAMNANANGNIQIRKPGNHRQPLLNLTGQ